ncbi:3-oxoacyl-[acyl-carrier-protein] synthase III C-terminal domain-containing protein [Persephonella sp.]
MRVFISDTSIILPEVYDVEFLIDKIYPVEKVGERTNRLLHKLSRSVGIKKKPLVFDIDRAPEIVLKKPEYHPLNWGKEIIERFASKVGRENIGFLSVSYNITFNQDYLPNLASQLVMETGLKTDLPPEELPFYGCASGIYSLKSAVDYCRKYGKAAVVFTFDQCSRISYFTYDENDPFFKKTLKSYFLFSDGAAGILVVPENLLEKTGGRAVEIEEIKLHYTPGDAIKMEEGKFILKNELKDVVPPIVAGEVIKPVLTKYGLGPESVDEWALHQGGFAILEKFLDRDILGLSRHQIKDAWELLEMYGNFSSPSCFFVFDRFFKKEEEKKGKRGMIVGFGAGYYMGAALYRWV